MKRNNFCVFQPCFYYTGLCVCVSMYVSVRVSVCLCWGSSKKEWLPWNLKEKQSDMDWR